MPHPVCSTAYICYTSYDLHELSQKVKNKKQAKCDRKYLKARKNFKLKKRKLEKKRIKKQKRKKYKKIEIEISENKLEIEFRRHQTLIQR